MNCGLPPPASVSVRLLWPYLRLLDSKGLGLERESVSPWLVDPEARIDHGLVVQLMLAAIEKEQDPARGLKAALLVEPEDREPVEHAARGQSTLAGAFHGLCRWFPVLNSACDLTLHQTPSFAELRYEVTRGVVEPHAFADSVVSWLGRFCTRYAGIDESDLVFQFRQPRPAYAQEFDRNWDAKTVFGARHNALILPAQLLARSLPRQSSTLTRAYELRAEELLGKLGLGTIGIGGRIRCLIADHLDEGIVSMSWVAEQLDMSVATLRRRLREEDTTFSRLIEEYRVELAERKLRDNRVSVTQIAAALGFANVSAFDRAFKRWRGAAPSEYRTSSLTPENKRPPLGGLL
jgi:AraC-like DNA-binding protein